MITIRCTYNMPIYKLSHSNVYLQWCEVGDKRWEVGDGRWVWGWGEEGGGKSEGGEEGVGERGS